MKNLLFTLLLLFMLSICPESYSNDKLLIVGSEQDYPPFALGLTDATASGFTVELWRAVAAESHLNARIRVLPFHDVLAEFKAGKIDVLINLAQSDERRQFADFTVPHVIVHGAIFVRHGENSIHSEADLKSKRIIVLNADLAHDYALAKGWQKQLVLADTPEQGFQLLASGQYDALLLSKLAGQQTLEKLNITNIKVLPIKVDFAQKFSFAVQKGNAELLARINEGLALTKASGIYDRLYEKWFGIYEEKAVLPLLLQYLAPIVSFFLLMVGIIFYRRSVERKQVIAALQESESRFRLLADSAPVLIWISGPDKLYIWFNKIWLDFTGRTMEQELGNGWTEGVHPDDFQRCLDHYVSHFDLYQAFSMEYRLKRHDGEYRWILDSGVPRFDSAGNFSGFIGSCVDITEFKNAEAALRCSNADLTRFAEVFAHHLLEPTRRLTSYSQRLRKLLNVSLPAQDPAEQEINASLDYLQRDANRLQTMVRDIQLYLAAAEPRGQLQLEEVNSVITQLQKRLRPEVNALKIIVISPNLPPAFLDRPRLLDLFGLIIDNALRHGQPANPDLALQIVISGTRIGKLSRYSIRDNGKGIPAEYHERVFEIFERLGHSGETGSGIGLAIARRIVESRRGKIWIENPSHSGTCVTFELPDGE